MQEAIERYRYFDKPTPKPKGKKRSSQSTSRIALPSFENGRELREYQVTGVKWMLHHNIKKTNCILGDEVRGTQ